MYIVKDLYGSRLPINRRLGFRLRLLTLENRPFVSRELDGTVTSASVSAQASSTRRPYIFRNFPALQNLIGLSHLRTIVSVLLEDLG